MKRIKNAVWSGLWCVVWVNRKGSCNGGAVSGTAQHTRKGAIEAFESLPIRGDYKTRLKQGRVKAIRLYVCDRTKGA